MRVVRWSIGAVDFLSRRPNSNLWLIEAKDGKTVRSSTASSLLSQRRALPTGSGRLIVVLAEAVRDEVEENLLLHAAQLPALDADQLIEDYGRLINLTSPELVPYPNKDLVDSSRHLIRHAADVPVLLSAMASKPNWLLTHNTKHFTKAIAQRTSLRIATTAQFSRALSALLR